VTDLNNSLSIDDEPVLKTKSLLGRTIVDMREATSIEMAIEGWTGAPPMILVLDDGTKVYASRDTRGSGPGVLFLLVPEVPVESAAYGQTWHKLCVDVLTEE
jgi:hypothetical protein